MPGFRDQPEPQRGFYQHPDWRRPNDRYEPTVARDPLTAAEAEAQLAQLEAIGRRGAPRYGEALGRIGPSLPSADLRRAARPPVPSPVPGGGRGEREQLRSYEGLLRDLAPLYQREQERALQEDAIRRASEQELMRQRLQRLR